MKLKKLTLKEHRQVGGALKQFRDQQAALWLLLSMAYGKQSRPARLSENLLKLSSELRCALDDQAFRDHPGAAVSQLYYGPLKKNGKLNH